MLPYAELMALPPRENIASHTARDTILYALGLGVGSERPTDSTELSFVYEEGLRALPTMPLVIAYPGFYLKEPRYRVDWAKVLHGEQRLSLHKPVPVAGTIRSVLTFDEVYDKGPDKGALLFATRKLYDEATGDLIATLGSTSFLRGDGGCGGRTDSAPPPHPIPDRPPDQVVDLPTRIDQALLYRLSGAYFDIVEDSAFNLDDFKRKIAKQFAPLRNIRTKILHVKVRSDGAMAYAYSTQNFISDTVDGGKVDLIFRETDVFEKRGGKWLLVHQHLSLPVDVVNGKAIMRSTATIPPQADPGP